PHVLHDPIDERPRRTRGFHRNPALEATSRQQPRNPSVVRRPPLLPLPFTVPVDRADLEKRLVQIDPEIFLLHGRPPLTSGALSVAQTCYDARAQDGRFI